MNKEIFRKPGEITDPNLENWLLPILVYVGIATLLTIGIAAFGILIWWLIF